YRVVVERFWRHIKMFEAFNVYMVVETFQITCRFVIGPISISLTLEIRYHKKIVLTTGNKGYRFANILQLIRFNIPILCKVELRHKFSLGIFLQRDIHF